MIPEQETVKSSPIVEAREKEQEWRGVSTVVVSGYLSGPRPTEIPVSEWRWKLYRTLALDDYLEFKWEDVVHFENVNTDTKTTTTDNLEPAVLWLSENALVSIGDFLVGEVAELFLPHADLASSLGSQARGGAIFIGRSQAGCTRNPGCGEPPDTGKP
jgi:hypothetical protein